MSSKLVAARRRPDEEGAADINWETGLCYIRRGYTRLKDMNPTTKNREVYPITIPASLLAGLAWHCRAQLPKGQESSICLFPPEKGHPRQGSILTKPFIEASQAIGLKVPLTLRGMRRTFNRLMKKADVEDMITRSITGHKTAAMQDHYPDKDAEQHRNAIEAAMAILEGRWSKQRPHDARLEMSKHHPVHARCTFQPCDFALGGAEVVVPTSDGLAAVS